MKVYLPKEKSEDSHRLEYMGPATVFRAPSSSRQGLFHYITVYKDSRGIICSCEGFTFNKKCWHVAAVPLCLEKDPNDFVAGRMVAPKQCSYVDQHEGEHSWETATE